VNVCLVTSEYPPFAGGIATYTAALARLLAVAGHGVVILYTGRVPVQVEHSSGIRVVQLFRGEAGREARAQQVFPDLSPLVLHVVEAGCAVREWLRHNADPEKIDVVEVPDFLGVGALLHEPGLPPCVVAGHGSLGQMAVHDPGVKDASRRFLESLEVIGLCLSDAVVCHSESNQRDLSRWLGREVLFASAPRGSSGGSDGAPRLQRDSAASDGLHAVVLGRLQVWKGSETMCAALRILGPDSDVHVDWYGNSVPAGDGRGDMAAWLAATYPDVWGKQFHWHRAIQPDDARDRVAGADVLAVPSHWETFGYAAVEATDLGVPIVISDGAGASYLFENDVSAAVVRSGDAAHLAAALRRMSDPSVRAEFARAARIAVDSRLTPENVVAERLAAYGRARSQWIARNDTPYFESGLEPLMHYLLYWGDQTADWNVNALSSGKLMAQLLSRARVGVSGVIRWPFRKLGIGRIVRRLGGR
jgi:glycogen(starch) synthase